MKKLPIARLINTSTNTTSNASNQTEDGSGFLYKEVKHGL